MNGIMCYFPQSAIPHERNHVRGRNIDISIVETKTRMQHCFSLAFKKFHIAIWFWMLLEVVMEILPILMPQVFVDHLGSWTYYYLKDLKCVYFTCRKPPYGKEDQMLLIEDEPNKALQNSHCSGLFIKSFKGQELLRNKD